MPVGWIDQIWNNSARDIQFKSVDTANNGYYCRPGECEDTRVDKTTVKAIRVELEDGQWHPIQPGQYFAHWCGIPWYFEGRHFKVLSGFTDANKELLFFNSFEGGKTSLYGKMEGQEKYYSSRKLPKMWITAAISE